MSSTMDPAKLKVVELRQELSKRGLDAKGNKPALVKRLKDALEEELKEELPDTSIADTSTEDLDSSQSQGHPEPEDDIKQLEPDKESEELSLPVTEADESKLPEKESNVTLETETEPEPELERPLQEEKIENNIPPALEEQVEPTPEPEPVSASEPTIEEEKSAEPDIVEKVSSEEEEQAKNVEPMEVPIEENKENGDQDGPKSRKSRWGSEAESIEIKENEDAQAESNESEMKVDEVKPNESDTELKGEKRKRSTPSPDRSQRRRSKSPVKEDEPSIDNDKVQLSWYDSDLHLQLDKESFLSAKPYHEGAFGFAWAGVRATHGVNSGKVCFEVKITEELKWEDYSKFYEKHRKDQHRSTSKHKNDDKKKTEETSKAQEKEHSQPENGSKSENPATEMQDEPLEDSETAKPEENAVTADAVSETTPKEEEPMETEPIEEKQDQDNQEKPENQEENQEDNQEKQDNQEENQEKGENLDKGETEEKQENEESSEKQENEESSEKVDQPSEAEPQTSEEQTTTQSQQETEEVAESAEPAQIHLFRVGWSLLDSSLQLGEQKFSYGYESTGRFVTDKNFQDYGIKFGVGDVVSSFLNVDEENFTISYAVNGLPQSEAITVPKSEIPENFVLFPHILSRNCAFELNLGSKEEAWFANPEGFDEFVFLDKVESKLAGPVRPESRSDCEVILMCGLPASGKTHWVQEYIQSNPDKKYTLLGNTHLLERMTISGDPLKAMYKGSWNILLDKLQKCLNKLVELSAFRRRNYIIDQTNVFPSAQRRKLRPFEGFKRRAVVVVVGDEEQAKRQSLQEAQDGKDVPDSAVLEMKANMSLPHKGEWIDEVIFAGLPEDEAKAVVQKYNSQGRDAGYGIQRRFGHRDDRHRWQNRRNDYRGGNYRERNYHNNRYDRGPPRQGGNWHQQQQQRSGGWNRDRRDNRGPPMGGGSRDWRNRGRDRGNRDNHGQGNNYNRNRSQGGSGGRSGGGTWQSSNWSQGQGQGNNWNNQAWGNQSAWSQQGGWSNQSNQNQWKYGGGSGGGGGGSGSSSGGGNSGGQGYSQGYTNWNYYGQYPQNWNQQGQSQSTGAVANQYGQYSQQEWAQYAQQYAQGQNTSVTTPTQSSTQK